MLYFGKGQPGGVVRQLGVFLMVLGLAGCVGAGVKPGANLPQDVVAKKAQSRWDALIKGDLETAYNYLSPGTRNVMSLDLYKAKIRPGMWKKASVDSVACEMDHCDVVIMIEYAYRGVKSLARPLNETWLQDDNGWWFVPRK